MAITSNSKVPLGVSTGAISPTDLPSNPFPIGESIDILRSFKSASLPATKSIFHLRSILHILNLYCRQD